MFLRTQPAHLQQHVNQKLSAEQRDVTRASLLRDMLKDVPRPKSMAVSDLGPDAGDAPPQ
jgi:hypothetical protein